MTIGDRIKQRRLELNMTQEELAKLLGYTSKSTIAKIEADANQLRQSKIKRIAEVLQTTTSYIMGWNDFNEEMPKFEPEHDMLIHLYSSLNGNEKSEFMELVKKYVPLDAEKKNAVLTVVRSLSL